MFQLSKYTVMVPTIAEAPPKALPRIGKKLAVRLGGTVSDLFPEFAQSFPKTVASMEKHWSRPKLAVTDMGSNWLPDLFLESEELNLFFCGPVLDSYYDEHPEFREDYFGHLPPRWITLYDSMSSFVITGESVYSPLGWRNTPLGTPHGIDTFSTETHTKKSKLKAFAKQLGAASELLLKCYLLTDAHDSLWVVDDERRDKKVYHVKADRFEEAFQLPDSENTLDEYMAHLVAGGQPADFDFRAPGT